MKTNKATDKNVANFFPHSHAGAMGTRKQITKLNLDFIYLKYRPSIPI